MIVDEADLVMLDHAVMPKAKGKTSWLFALSATTCSADSKVENAYLTSHGI